MEIYILNENLQLLSCIDIYKSLVWCERYYTASEFELELPASRENINMLKKNYYVSIDDSQYTMIIDEIEINTDAEAGDTLKVKGKSLEFLLNRRIIWSQTTVSGNVENAIYKLLNENIMGGASTNRKINNFTMQKTGKFERYKVDAQYTGDNLYDVIVSMCQNFNIGFQILLQDGKFVFTLYEGVDRSYNQNAVPFVVYSPDFENIINSNFYTSSRDYANVALIGGEGEGTARKMAMYGSGAGIARREIFVDARDLSQNLEDSDESKRISDLDYIAQLKQRGAEGLAERQVINSFDGEIEAEYNYVYKKDFYVGDIIQISTEYEIEAAARIIEMMITKDDSGTKFVPTFA